MIVGARIGIPAIVVAVIGELTTPWLRAKGLLGPDDPFRKVGFLVALGSIMGAAIVDLPELGGSKRLRESGLAELLPRWPRSLLLASMALLSYWLILWVWSRAPIALASALRDTSAIFATLIAVFVLREPLDRRVLAAVALATAGTVAIRLG